jgi:PII-like signaling protein
MRQTYPAKLLRILVFEDDRYQGRPLHEAIVTRCRELGIAGATVLRGLEGYGEDAALRRPLSVVIVDTEPNLARLLEGLAPMLAAAVLATSSVEVTRLQREPGPT